MKTPTELLADYRHYHDDTQMDLFITGRAGGTAYGCYLQALREMEKRVRGLLELYSSRELLLVDLEQMGETEIRCPFDRRRMAIQLETKRLGMRSLDRNICDTEREFSRFYQQAASLKEHIGELTPDKRATLEREMWEHRIKCTAAVDSLSSGRLGTNTITMLQSLPPEPRAKLCGEIFAADGGLSPELAVWFLSDSVSWQFTPVSIEAGNVKRIVQDASL